MKLVKVFSDGLFKNVQFNSGFNVVLATISDRQHKKDTHNLGKSSLLVVLDFLLLGEYNHSSLLANPIFKHQTFYLELLLNSGKYLVIKRNMMEPTKISFKQNDEPLLGFEAPRIWDEEKLAFNKAKEKLNNYLGFDVTEMWSYRNSITYFLRSQKDYLDVFQLSKYTKGKQILWKPFVFELLGFNSQLLHQKLEVEDKIAEKQKEIEILSKEAQFDVNEKDKISGLIDVKSQMLNELTQEIDKFNFYSTDVETTKEIINNIDAELQSLNAERYHINHAIRKISDSLQQANQMMRLSNLKELFEQVSLYFPAELMHKYEELENFSSLISAERGKYLHENLSSLQQTLDDINQEIKKKEELRSIKIMSITDASSYEKFKTCQKELASAEADVKLLQEKLRLIDRSNAISLQIEELKEAKKEYAIQIKNAIDGRAHAEINRIFNQILMDVVGENAIISIKQNTEGNVEFNADYLSSKQITTSEAEGTSYKKLLCVAFDLSLLIHYSAHSFYKFVYHDGVMEGLDDRIKLRLLNTIDKLCREYNIQYIVSIIDSDIPLIETGAPYVFEDNSICLRLNDSDNAGKLFLRSF